MRNVVLFVECNFSLIYNIFYYALYFEWRTHYYISVCMSMCCWETWTKSNRSAVDGEVAWKGNGKH